MPLPSEQEEFLAKLLFDQIVKGKRHVKQKLSDEECLSWSQLSDRQKYAYYNISYKLVRDYKLDVEKTLKF